MGCRLVSLGLQLHKTGLTVPFNVPFGRIIILRLFISLMKAEPAPVWVLTLTSPFEKQQQQQSNNQ